MSNDAAPRPDAASAAICGGDSDMFSHKQYCPVHRLEDSHSRSLIPRFCRDLIGQSSLPASTASKPPYAVSELDIDSSEPSQLDHVLSHRKFGLNVSLHGWIPRRRGFLAQRGMPLLSQLNGRQLDYREQTTASSRSSTRITASPSGNTPAVARRDLGSTYPLPYIQIEIRSSACWERQFATSLVG